MRKYKSAYLKPYIRKMKKTDQADNIRMAIELAYYSKKPKAYVFVQRGTNTVIAVDTCRANLIERIVGVQKGKDFNKWCNYVKKKVQRR